MKIIKWIQAWWANLTMSKRLRNAIIEIERLVIEKHLVESADLTEKQVILFPCAGVGDIPAEVPMNRGHILVCVEKDMIKFQAMQERLPHLPNLLNNDFTQMYPNENDLFDRIIMFPNTNSEMDIHMILHAHGHLAVGGKLVAALHTDIYEQKSVIGTSLRSAVDQWVVEKKVKAYQMHAKDDSQNQIIHKIKVLIITK